ncbi:DUF3524 domain-containing protein [candidate division KSB1 bacterium]|nr:DUF3524 domain-containing protein [candidate division KSB1 bacterium]
MNILILEPYFAGSHADWASGYQKYSKHNIRILSMKGQFWKWRMHGGAVTLAREFLSSEFVPDLILATDMLDLATFLALTRGETGHIPVILYFHENQLAYPWSPDNRDIIYKRDKHYGFINYTSALVADAVFFNSRYNMDSFLNELRRFLKHFPDYNESGNVDKIAAKSGVLHLGLDLSRFDRYRTEAKERTPVILWNHRWEFDKNPGDFFRALFILTDEGLDFQVVILGENFSVNPAEFDKARRQLGERILQFGYVENFAEYARWLWRVDIIPVTSRHDFFGASVMEAVYCNCFPLLPNRLAYPELIPGELHPEYLYDNFENLVDRLRNAVLNINRTRKFNLNKTAGSFRWENMANIYDERMEAVVGHYN